MVNVAGAQGTVDTLVEAGFCPRQADALGEIFSKIDARLDVIEARLDRIEARLDEVIRILQKKDADSAPSTSVRTFVLHAVRRFIAHLHFWKPDSPPAYEDPPPYSA